jgi:hypothetical protein
MTAIRGLDAVRAALIAVLVFLSMFDPAGRVFGAKYVVFVLLSVASIPSILSRVQHSIEARRLLLYFSVFSLVIPVYGLLVGLIVQPEFELRGWFGYFAAHLYLMLALCIMDRPALASSVLLAALNALAVLTIVLFVYGKLVGYEVLSAVGQKYEIFTYSERFYGRFRFHVVYYYTSPLLVLSLAYWSFRVARRADWISAVMFSVTALALFLSGTRNNLIASVALPVICFFLCGRRRWVLAVVGMALLSTPFIQYGEVFSRMFATTDASNSVKLGYLADYLQATDNLPHLFLGQGLGSFFYASPLQREVNVTELTYLEILRMYGIYIGTFVIAMIAYPLTRLVVNRSRPDTWIFVGYGFYLLISMLNPYIYSSNGMLIISIVVANYFMTKGRRLLHRAPAHRARPHDAG